MYKRRLLGKGNIERTDKEERQPSGRDFGYRLTSAESSNFKMRSKKGDITFVSTIYLSIFPVL